MIKKHSLPPAAAPGTPMTERAVGELVAAFPALSRVFQAHDLGFCCQGSLTVAEACAKRGLDPVDLVAKLEAELGREEVTSVPSADLDALSPEALVAKIAQEHHDFFRAELPRLHAMARRVAQVHGEHTPSLVTLSEVFVEVGQELAAQTVFEEDTLFPEVLQNRKFSGGEETLLNASHEATGEGMERLRGLTNDFVPPPQACNTYRALFSGLADLAAHWEAHRVLEAALLKTLPSQPA